MSNNIWIYGKYIFSNIFIGYFYFHHVLRVFTTVLSRSKPGAQKYAKNFYNTSELADVPKISEYN